MSRNSITPSRALRTMGERVDSTLGEPSLFGIRSRTAMAQEACGFGTPTTSIRHMRQLPAIESRSWKQKRGISAPAASQACSSVYSGGTSISRLSTMSLVMSVPVQKNQERHGTGDAERHVDAHEQREGTPKAIQCDRTHPHLAVFQSCADAILSQLNAWSLGPFALRCSSRATASAMVGRCPAGTHHITR